MTKQLTLTEATLFIQSESKRVWNEYDQAFQQMDLEMPAVIITDNKTSVAGRAWRSCKKVEFNLRFCMTVGKEEFSQVIYHEFAHIVQFHLFKDARQAHGPEFRFILERMGRAVDTYHSFSVVAAKKVSLEVTIDDL